MNFFKNKIAIVVSLILIVYTVWRLFLGNIDLEIEAWKLHYWGGTYQIVAIIGGIWGIIVAKKWGGYKSRLGRTILAFSFGLLAQSFGQTVYTYYVIKEIEAVYPSLGDVGYFGSVLFYIYGSLELMRVCYVRLSLKSTYGLIKILTIPALILGASYYVFLKDYQFDFAQPITLFLDIGYPLGQALYVSLVLIILVSSKNILGGIMQKPTVFLLVALIMQYVSDYTFLYLSSRSLWVPGGINDYMYLVSYYLMTVALINIGRTFADLKNS